MNALEIVCDIARTTAMKHREEGRRALADQIDTALAALMVPTHRHVKTGGDYALLGFGKMQSEDWQSPLPGHVMLHRVDMREVAIYRSVEDGSLWIRPREEFEDGRFVAIDDALTPMTDNARRDEGKLLPCPFCGADPHMAHIVFGYQSLHNGRDGYRVECGECHVQQHAYALVQDEATDAWNTRALARRSIQEQPETVGSLHVLFDGPPSHESGRFVEVEDDSGKSVRAGEWVERPGGLWDLVIPRYAPPPIAGAGWKVEASGLAVATIQADDFSLIELTRREGGGFNLTIHAGDEESGRWDDLSIGLSTSRTAELVGYLVPVPDNTDARAAQVKALGWHQNIDGLCLSEGGLVRYRVNQPTNANVWRWATSANGPFSEPFSTLDDAKAAAQADYASRIRAAIIPGTDASEVIEQLREALKPFAAVAADYIEHGMDHDESIMSGRIPRNGEPVPPVVTFADFRAALDPVKAPIPLRTVAILIAGDHR